MIEGAKSTGADRIEFYTESYANNFKENPEKAIRKYELGESNIIEKLTAKQKRQELVLMLQELDWAKKNEYHQLKNWIQFEGDFDVPTQPYIQLNLEELK